MNIIINITTLALNILFVVVLTIKMYYFELKLKHHISNVI